MSKKVQRLVSKSEFARLAGVWPSALTKLVKGRLLQALQGDKIDLDHPDAIAYLKEKKKEPTKPKPKKGAEVAVGVDPLYEKCVEYATMIGKVSITSLRKQFQIGYNRAKIIVGIMEANGIAKKIEKSKAKAPQPPKDKPAAGEPKKPQTYPELPGADYYGGEDLEDILELTVAEVVNKFGTSDRFHKWLQARKTIVDIGAKEITNAEKRGKLISREYVEKFIIGQFEKTHMNLMTDGSKKIASRIMKMTKSGATLEECEEYASKVVSSHITRGKEEIKKVLQNV